MTTLTARKPKNTYKDLLQVSNSNAGIDGTRRAVEDGEGTSSTLKLGSAGSEMTAVHYMTGGSVVYAEGAAVASAAAPNIWANDGNTIHITGTTGITSFAAAPQAGARMWLIFDDAVLLTDSANLKLNNGGSNYTTAAGDVVLVYADTTTQFDLFIFPVSGLPVATVTVAKGGTGSTTAAAAATALGLGTGDSPQFTEVNVGHATDTTLARASAGNLTVEGNALYRAGGTDVAVADGGTGSSTAAAALAALSARGQGLETIWVPGVAMYARTTNGAASGTVETATSLVMRKTFDFDTATQEFAQFQVRFPKSYNGGTATFAPIWTAASGSGGVVFGLAGVALSDDDAFNTAFGTAQTSTDTLITAADVHVGPTSSAITIAGIPAAGDLVCFQINRTVADGGDTLGVDATLLGVALFFTTNAVDDT